VFADILFQWTQMGWKVFPPHRWVAFAVLFWGTVSSVQAACTSWEGLMVCRFLLAIPEAMYGPAVPLYLSSFSLDLHWQMHMAELWHTESRKHMVPSILGGSYSWLKVQHSTLLR
jgi:MFS family permease